MDETVVGHGGEIRIDTKVEDMARTIPLDLAVLDWRLVPEEIRITDERSGSCHILVYVRPFSPMVDAAEPKPGYVMRREQSRLVRVSTYAVCCRDWDRAYAEGIERMRTVDAQRRLP